MTKATRRRITNIINILSALICIAFLIATVVCFFIANFGKVDVNDFSREGLILFGLFSSYGWIPGAFVGLLGIEYLVSYRKRYEAWKKKGFPKK